MTYFLTKLFFFLGFEGLIDQVRHTYQERKKQQLTSKLKYAGHNLTLPISNIFFNPQYVSIGNNFIALHNLRIEAIDNYSDVSFLPKIIIGDNVCMNSDVHIGAINEVRIGSNVLLASRIYISDHSHGSINAEELIDPPLKRKLSSKGPVIIEDNVWIGEGVFIMSGVTIGKNSIIGANAVVTKSIPENSVAVGIPAKVIRKII